MASGDEDDPAITSAALFRLAKAGDREAIDALFSRHLPPLRRWASGRLPRWARQVAETTDIVQDALFNAFRRLSAIEHRRKGALQAYLRESIHNRIRDEIRASARLPPTEPADSSLVAAVPSPLAAAIDNEALERYRSSLCRLSAADQELIVGRIELGYSYDQLALATHRRGADAARVALARAVVRLAGEMNRDR